MTTRTIACVAGLAVAMLGCKDRKEVEGPMPEATEGEAVEVTESSIAPEKPRPEIDDAEITDAIERELLYDGTVVSANVGVETNDGIAELTGEVSHLLAKERAASIARAVKGVRSVSNRLDVVPVKRRDAEIEKEVRRTLVYDPAAESYELTVDVGDAVVTLNGTVELWQEKQLAETLAKSIKGVKSVENEIEIDYGAEVSDYEIEQSAEARLKWDPLVDEELVEVKVSGGHVALSGTVGSASERLRVMRNAWVKGVESVDVDGLEVQWWAKDTDLRKKGHPVRSDVDIADAIADAALYDPRVKSFNLQPQVSGGVVTLTGVVSNLKAKHAAEQLAKNTVGVIRVDNELEVEPEKPVADAELAGLINAGLMANPITESHEIAVTVNDGSVTLKGSVDSFFEAAEAENVAMSYAGVTDVTNEMVIREPLHAFYYGAFHDPYFPDIMQWKFYVPTTTELSDTTIEERVQNEILWDPAVDLSQVTVAVESGKVTLKGTVDSLAEKLEAEENAYEGGAVMVDNQLKVF